MIDRPNIILVTSHDTGRHLHCYGADSAHTPNLDALAEQGVRFARAFCCAPQCSPSRSGIATGRHPHANGVMGLTHAQFAWDLHPEERTIGQLLAAAGYATVLAGIQHESRRDAAGLGFERELTRSGNGAQIAAAVSKWLAEEAPRDRPFYLQAGTFETHRANPANYYNHPPDWRDGVTVPPYLLDDASTREDFAMFEGSVKGLDDAVGTMLAGLEAAGLAGNTLFIYTTDHGIPFPRAKCSVYEPGLEVGLIARWPQGPAAMQGLVYDGLFSNVDLLPTVLELAGVPVPASVQGVSHAAPLRGEPGTVRDAVFGELTYHGYCDPCRSVRTETHKLIVNFSTAKSFLDPSQQWRPQTVTRVPVDPARAFHVPVELYDLQNDPLETVNLVDDEALAGVRRELLGRLHAWMVETQDPLLQGIPSPPMYRMGMHAVLTGQVVNRPEEIAGER